MRHKIKKTAHTAATAVIMLVLMLAASCSDISVPVSPWALLMVCFAAGIGLLVFVKTDC
ncbi:MAG: hypothetical protein J1F63_00265 [Oscillospiraceae bacterium]|nr:hypothetical protein [Oscillospiraceae bacterium]